MSPKHSEARREPRLPASGSIRVAFRNPQEVKLEGALVDLSASGFRMAHTFARLEPGQIVEFSYIGASGRARVVWNRVADQRVETGFLILSA
jgi:hypothetical protein